MNKKFLGTLLSLAVLMSSFSLGASAKEVPQSGVTYAPATLTTINGVPEGRIKPNILMEAELIGYNSSQEYTVPYWKQIASTRFDNSSNPYPADLTLSIQHSSQQGSEFSASVDISASAKAIMLANIGASVGYGVKETRATNDAVGFTGHVSVPPYSSGRIVAYYEGISSHGTATIRQYETSSLQGYYDYTAPAGAIVFPDDIRVNFRYE